MEFKNSLKRLCMSAKCEKNKERESGFILIRQMEGKQAEI